MDVAPSLGTPAPSSVKRLKLNNILSDKCIPYSVPDFADKGLNPI